MEKILKITSETEVTPTELACVLGITARRIRQLSEDGQLIKSSSGKFNLADSVQRYQTIFSKANNQPNDEEKEQDKKRISAEVSLKQSKAIKAGLEVEELRGKLHRSEDVANMTEDLIFTLRSHLIALPGRIAVDVAEAANAAEAAEIIRKETHLMMEDMMRYRYDPGKYAERVRERQRWEKKDDITEE